MEGGGWRVEWEGGGWRVEGRGGEWRGRVEEREVTHVRREEGGGWSESSSPVLHYSDICVHIQISIYGQIKPHFL